METSLHSALRDMAAICERMDHTFMQAQKAELGEELVAAAMDAALTAGAALAHLVTVYLDVIAHEAPTHR